MLHISDASATRKLPWVGVAPLSPLPGISPTARKAVGPADPRPPGPLRAGCVHETQPGRAGPDWAVGGPAGRVSRNRWQWRAIPPLGGFEPPAHAHTRRDTASCSPALQPPFGGCPRPHPTRTNMLRDHIRGRSGVWAADRTRPRTRGCSIGKQLCFAAHVARLQSFTQSLNKKANHVAQM